MSGVCLAGLVKGREGDFDFKILSWYTGAILVLFLIFCFLSMLAGMLCETSKSYYNFPSNF